MTHGRVLIGSVRDWPAYFAQCYMYVEPILHGVENPLTEPCSLHSHAKSGGYVEAQEMDVEILTDDDSFPPDSAIREWCRLGDEGAKNMGLQLRISSSQLKQWMEEAGFVDVTVVEFKLPLGAWPADKRLREAGSAEWLSMRDNLLGVTLRIWEKGLGRSYESLEVFLVKVRAEFDNKAVHPYFPL